MIYCFDIDGTLCETRAGDYKNAQPMVERIRFVNGLYEKGHTIKMATARGAETGMDWLELTEHQLTQWGVRYNELFMGKPYADVYVDDRAVSAADFFKGK